MIRMRVRRSEREREKKIQGGWSCARLFWQIVDRLKLDAKIRVIELRREKKSVCVQYFCNCLPKRLCINKSDKNR